MLQVSRNSSSGRSLSATSQVPTSTTQGSTRGGTAREVVIYEGDVWAAIQEATQGEPNAIWVLGGGQNKRLTVDQFVLEDGRAFRTQETHDSLLKACRHLAPEDPEALASRVFGENHAASVVTREKNVWKPTPVNLLDMVQAAFQGQGEAAPWFQRFGHPRHRMTRVAVNGPLGSIAINDIGTGFAQVRSWQFAAGLHPVVASWFGSHFEEKQWMPTALLAYMVETGLLTKLQVAEAIVAFEKQTEVWLPDSRDQACSVIGKFRQGAKADGKRLTRRLVTDQGELDFLVRDCRQSGTLVGAPERCPAGWILTYYDGSQPQFAHLRASMLAYAHINLLEMLRRFTPNEAVPVAIDSIYVKKTELHKLEGVEAYVSPGTCVSAYKCGGGRCIDCYVAGIPMAAPRGAQWQDKGEKIYSPQDHAAYEPKSEHSFFRWSGQAEWTPDRMGQKYIPRVIIWDEFCTVPRPVLETFLDWLNQRGVQVICFGDQGQPPPIAGESPHDWFKERCDYYEEITVDHRSRWDKLKALKRAIRLQPDRVQCKEMRKALPQCRGWTDFVDFVDDWQPRDLILVTRSERCGGGVRRDSTRGPQRKYLNQLARCCPPPDADGRPPPAHDVAVARKNIGRKIQSYKRVDAAEGHKCNLRLKDVEALKEKQSNRCASCNIDLLWCYEPKDTRQFSVDRIDNAKGHTCDNVRLACLECNRKQGAAALTLQPPCVPHCEATKNGGVPPGNVSAGQLQDLFDSI
ncbi:hypothetical protein RRG08_065962 [Elysia crispata]|uniref:Uncharacterized protein n=1 Tax=Elysia crispata TaxID=231223 RepID=A0AAE0ZFT7_9GAST|nr:hypothetical protein RRG08_065962 [Elysia crispata]